MFAAELSGMPESKWVQAEDLSGKHGKHSSKHGKHSRMKRVRVWNGSEGALGYFCYLAEQRVSIYVRFLEALLAQNVPVIVPEADKDEEPITLRADLVT